MNTLHQNIEEYKNQMKKGVIPQAYQGLMEFILNLKTFLKSKRPDFYVSGNIYQGYMDMTYFSFTPEFLKNLKLKIAVVFVHEDCCFEVWLAAANKQIQEKYWNIFRTTDLNQYKLSPSVQGYDSIVEYRINDNPDFSNPGVLKQQIESAVMKFIKDIEKFMVLIK